MDIDITLTDPSRDIANSIVVTDPLTNRFAPDFGGYAVSNVGLNFNTNTQNNSARATAGLNVTMIERTLQTVARVRTTAEQS